LSRKLSIEGLTKSYRGRPVIRDISLHIQSGEVVGLLGPNGAGKTTLLRAASGLIRPTGGDILLDGQSVLGLPPPVTRVPQHTRVWRSQSLEKLSWVGTPI